MKLYLSEEEFKRRKVKVKEKLIERGLHGLCLFLPKQIFYLTGFSFIATERPIALALSVEDDKMSLMIPILEKEHVETITSVADEVEIALYPEYPGKKHPMKFLHEILTDMKLDDPGKRVGVDSDGYFGRFGYIGPKLSEIVEAEVVNSKDIIEDLMQVKTEEEIALIKESAKWGNLAHTLLQKYTQVGLVETEIAARASYEASMSMIRTLGPDYKLTKYGRLPATAGFRGQIGPQSAIPHAITTNARICSGDILVTGAGAEVGGYGSELERTMVVGAPSKEQEKYFNLMLKAQNIALEVLQPGVSCSEVDQAVKEFFAGEGLEEKWRHHTGHALGFEMHEAPFLDIGDQTVLQPGMVLSIEPGIYIPGLGGFRHSDTVLVSEDGIEMITYYPRELESLIITKESTHQ